MSNDERRRAAAPDESAAAPSADRAAGWRERVERALSRLTLVDVSPRLERSLAKLAGAVRHLGEPPVESGPLLALETRRLIGASPGSASTGEGAWNGYAHGRKAQLSASDLRVLRQDLARAAADPLPAIAGGRLVRYRLQEVLDDLGIPREKAAGFLLDDLRESLTSDSVKRLARRGHTVQGAARAGSRTPLLTKSLLDTVFTDMEGEITAFAMQPAGDLLRYGMGKLAPLPEQDMLGSLHKLRGAALATEAADPESGESEAKEVVRLLERLVELARRYTVDLVGVLEHYLETAQRILREAQQVQARRQLANDQRAIERTLAELDPREVARRVAALPLYLHRRGGGEDVLATALLPRLSDERLARSYARLCLRLLQLPDAEERATPSADRPPPAASAANIPTGH